MGLLGGSLVAINGLISPLIWVLSIVTLLITLQVWFKVFSLGLLLEFMLLHHVLFRFLSLTEP